MDSPRKWAYRYRDYVIRALNNDKPWNEFLVEQLAGDELLTPPLANLTPEQADRLIATGMLRMGPDGTSDGAVDQNLARNDVIANTIKIVSTAVLGLTVGCAQCHDHRYDPISQADYYRIRAIFEPAYDWKNWRSPDARLVSLWTDETRKKADGGGGRAAGDYQRSAMRSSTKSSARHSNANWRSCRPKHSPRRERLTILPPTNAATNKTR